MENTFKTNPCVGCQYYECLVNVVTYHGKETYTGVAFICKNLELIKKIDKKERIPFFTNGKRVDPDSAIPIGRVFMVCE